MRVLRSPYPCGSRVANKRYKGARLTDTPRDRHSKAGFRSYPEGGYGLIHSGRKEKVWLRSSSSYTAKWGLLSSR
jgi:hypothetical protein